MTKQAMQTGAARAGYVRVGGVGEAAPVAANDLPGGVALMSAEQMRSIIAEAMGEALAAHVPAEPTGLLDRAGLCRALSCGPSMVDKLRRQGMPTIKLGDSPRFELDAVVEWLKAQHPSEAR